MINPRNHRFQSLMGAAHSKRGEYRKALALFQRVTTMAPESAQAHYNLGQALLLNNRSVEAQQSFEKAVKLDPAFAPANRALLNLHLSRGELDRARAYYRAYISLGHKVGEETEARLGPGQGLKGR